MAHVGIVALDVDLKHVEVLAPSPKGSLEEAFKPTPCLVGSPASLAGMVIVDKTSHHHRVDHIVVKAPLVDPIPKGDTDRLPLLRVRDHELFRRPWLVGAFL